MVPIGGLKDLFLHNAPNAEKRQKQKQNPIIFWQISLKVMSFKLSIACVNRLTSQKTMRSVICPLQLSYQKAMRENNEICHLCPPAVLPENNEICHPPAVLPIFVQCNCLMRSYKDNFKSTIKFHNDN